MNRTASPQAGRSSALPPDERRLSIVEAALPLVLERGEGVTTRQIAEAAGIAEGTIFRVFPDKDALLSAVLDAALDTTVFDARLAAIDDTLAFEERLVAATEVVAERIVLVWRLISNLGPRLREQAARPLADSAELAAIFEPEAHRLSMPPAEAARLLRALTLSTTHPMLAPEPMPAARIVELLLHGVEGTR